MQGTLNKTISGRLLQRDGEVKSAPVASSDVTKKVLLNLRLMSLGLVVAVVGSLMASPLLLLLSAVCQVYCMISFYQESYKALVHEKRVTVNVIDALVVTVALLGGLVVAAAIANWFATAIRFMIAKTEDHSMHRLVKLFGEQPHHVWILLDDLEVEIPFEQMKIDDIVVVPTSQMIPIDGTIVSGVGLVDQQRLTGESQPVEKGMGDSVFAATVVLSGKLFIQVEKAGTETLAAKVGDTLNRTTDYRMNIQSDAIAFVDKMSVPTLMLSGLALPFSGVSGALAVLWNVPGYRMMLFGPLNMLTYLYVSSQNSVLIKDGRSLDLLREVDTIVFDKTGTLTLEQFYLAQIHVLNHVSENVSENELLLYAASAEQRQTHPIAKAILQAARDRGLSLYGTDDTHYTVGNGIKASFEGKLVHVGSKRFMQSEAIDIPAQFEEMEAEIYTQGFSVVMVAIDRQLVGLLELHATIRPEAKSTLAALRALGMDMVIISGDYEAPTRFLAQELGIPTYFAEVLPEDKAALIKTLQDEGRSVCFVGDGINDSIALKQANVSVSIAGAATIATDTAHIILMQGTLTQLASIFDIVENYTSDLNLYYKATFIPAALCTVGTFLLGWGFMTAVVVSQGSSLLALGRVIQAIRQNS
ncbi:MAG: heavy metal translocating P-type ATPase [Chloroflexota bacterium]